MSSSKFILILLTAPDFVKNEPHIIKACLMLCPEALLHIRKPGWTKEEVANLIEALPRALYKRIVVHQHYDLCMRFRLRGIHFKDNSPRLEIAGVHHYSSSFHQLSQVASERSFLQYAFLAPIFDSFSKKRYKASFDFISLQRSLKKKHLPIIALGGINQVNISKAMALGFDGVAVLGSVWNCDNPLESWKRIVKSI